MYNSQCNFSLELLSGLNIDQAGQIHISFASDTLMNLKAV